MSGDCEANRVCGDHRSVASLQLSTPPPPPLRRFVLDRYTLLVAMAQPPRPQIQPCRYKTGKTLGAGSYSVVKECVHIDTGRFYAAKVINKRLMAGREHMVGDKFSRLLLRPLQGRDNLFLTIYAA